MKILKKAALALTLIGVAGFCSAAPVRCPGVRNEAPVVDIPPVHLSSVPNGDSWIMQEGTNLAYLARLRGTAREMGEAYGRLFAPELAQQFKNLDLMYPMIAHDMLLKFGVPEQVVAVMTPDLLLRAGELMIDINWQIALPFVPQRFIDEMEGIAAGAGLPAQTVIRANMLPELTQAHCTVVGAWGSATQDGNVIHLRALDWDAFAPINQFPAVVFYEPTEEGSHPFVNIGYMGQIGTLTSMSKAGISAGEKVMIVHDPSFYQPEAPEITYFGKPWMFVLRDTVQFADDLESVGEMLRAANRTMKIHGGWGSAKDNSFRGMNYAYNFLNLYDDKNYFAYDKVDHPQMDGVFFFDKHVQPSDDPCIPNILLPQHGNITAETFYRDIVGYHRTGDNKWAVMDPIGQQIWVQWSQYGTTINAFERSPIHIDLNMFWTKEESSSFLE